MNRPAGKRGEGKREKKKRMKGGITLKNKGHKLNVNSTQRDSDKIRLNFIQGNGINWRPPHDYFLAENST